MAKIQGYPQSDVDLLVGQFTKVVQGAIDRTCAAAANNLQPIIIGSVFHLEGKHSQKTHGHKTTVSVGEQQEFAHRVDRAKAGKKAYKSVASSDDFASEDQKAGIRLYQSSGEFLNGSLRRGDDPATAFNDDRGSVITHGLDSAFASPDARLKEDIVVHRGVQNITKTFGRDDNDQMSFQWYNSNRDGAGDNRGLTWDDAGFLSTTTSAEAGLSFAHLHGVDEGVVMRIHVPAGTPALSIGKKTGQPGLTGESEVLLPRGLRFRVMQNTPNVKPVDNTRFIDVEVVGFTPGEEITASLKYGGVTFTETPPDDEAWIDHGPPVLLHRWAIMEERGPDDVLPPDIVQPDEAVTAASSAGLTSADIAIVTQKWQEEVDGTLTPYIGEVYSGSATHVAIGLGTSFPDKILPGVPLVADDYTMTYMKTVTNRLVGVGDELWEDVRNELLDGVQQGQDIPQIAARIKAVSNFDRVRATRIARTEVHGAAESGSLAQMRMVGYTDNEVTKTWVATSDMRTRLDHEEADEQAVALSEKFSVGGWPIDHPGDPTAPASEVVNCRCTVVFEVQDPPPSRCAPVGSNLTAASTQATTCVTCVPETDISNIPTQAQIDIYNKRWNKHKISPAYGGAKILKTIDAVLAEMEQTAPDLAALLDREKILKIVDNYYPAKGATFSEKFHEWSQTPAGKKALATAKSEPKILAIKTPIAESSLPEITFDAKKAETFSPTAQTKYARVMDVPNGQTTVITPEWGGEQKFVGKWVAVYDPANPSVVKYGSAYDEWIDMHNPMPSVSPNAWQKVAKVQAYQYEGVPSQYTTVLENGTVETTNKVNPGDWVTKQKNGEIQIIKDENFKKQYLADNAQVSVPALPPIPAMPSPDELTFTGKTFASATKAQVWVDNQGQRWLFKTPPGGSNSYSAKTLLDLETSISRIQSKAKLTRPAIYKITLNGKAGTLQYMFDSTDAFPAGSFNPLTLSAADLQSMQQEQIFDWMVSNHDTHTGQWLRLKDGRLFAIDRGQAFKFFGKDKLDWNYVPVTPLGQDKLTYSPLWKAYVSGKDVALQNPTEGALGAYIDQLSAIPDATYRNLLEPYAKWRESEGIGSAEKFLDAAVARKNNLKSDFGDYWARAQAERAKHITLAPEAPPVVTPTSSVTNIIGQASDVTTVSATTQQNIAVKWIELGGGKKVTPAWGGSKIWKMLDQLKASSPGSDLTHMQLVKILDEEGGFVGKPKTYEGELTKWLQSPAGKKAVPNPPLSLLGEVASPAPAISPVLPVEAVIPDAATEAVTTQPITGFSDLLSDVTKYADGDVIAYAQTKSGAMLRMVKVNPKTTGFNFDVKIEVKTKAGAWVHDTLLSQSDIVPLKNEYEYVDGWHAVPPPATAKIATHIPGKMPGDPVDVAEINAAKFLFKDGDVIAVGKSYQANYRLISHGDGSMSWQPEHPPGSGTYTTLQTYTKDMPKNALNGAKWTYGPDIIAKKAPSAISGFDSGDVVTADHIFAAAQSASSDVNIAIAYAYDPAFVREYRVAKFGSDIQIQFRDANTTDVWKKLHFDVTQPSDIDVLGLKWRAAKMGGAGAPDEHLALFKGVPGQKVPAVGYPGKSVGDQISSAEILKSYNEHFKDLEIVAHGMSTFNTGVEYRMYWTDPTHFSMDYKENDGSGTWQFLTHIKDPQEWLKHNTNITWVATNDSVSAGSVSMKEAKKLAKTAEATITTKVGPKIVATNKVAGKVTGEVVEADDLLSNASAFDDGHVIAYGKGYGYSGKTYRLVRVDNQTIIQTQTKAGTWTQSHLVVNKYSGDFWNVKTWTVATENDVLAKPQLTAAKKFVAKATGTQTSAPVKTGKSYVPPSQPIKTTPFVLRPIDLTPWTDEEQKAIYDYYKQQSGSAHTGVEQVWGHVQNIKQHFQVTNPGGKYADLNEIHVLRILDAQGALKSNVTDTHPLEAKVVNWLKTPSGKSYINKRIDAPIAAHEVPAAMADFSASNISEDKQQYRIVTLSDARADRTQSLAKYGDWTAGQKSALKTYTGGAYHTWNDAIRKGELGSSRGSILNEQAAMRPSIRPMLLHRGTGFAELNDPSITNFESLKRHEGETYINRGFMSTSVGGHAAFGGQLLIEVEAPIGTPMAHVADFSSFKSENETTLAAHLVFRILSVEKKGGTTVMRVRVIGAAQG